MTMMKRLCQRDPLWASAPIGNTHLTIGRWGCTLTCISMLSDFFGCYKSPKEIASFPGLFNSNGEILWQVVDRLFQGKLRFQRRVGSRNSFIRDDKAIYSSLVGSPKTAVILSVAHNSHWVLAINTAGKDYRIVDPWDGKEKLLLPTYGSISGSAHFFQP